MSLRRVAVTAVAVLAASVGVAGAAEKLTVYTSIKESLVGQIRDAFVKRNPDIQVDHYSAGAGKLMAKIAAERQSGRLTVDVLWHSNPGPCSETIDSTLTPLHPCRFHSFGMVFQAFAVWSHLTVAKNVSFPLEIRGLSRAEINDKTRKALEYTGLLEAANSYPNQLSGGQKQRIALARSISFNPQVMLLDEPLSNLDQKMREEMRFKIKDLQRKFDFTIVYVTHDQAEAMALSAS